MKKFVLLGSAGVLGTLARYLLQGAFYRTLGGTFPYGTLVVNVLGCFLLGLFNGLFTDRFLIDPAWRSFFTIGFCGAFTTFSTFTFETYQLASGKNVEAAALNLFLSLFLGFLFLWFGIVLSRVF